MKGFYRLRNGENEISEIVLFYSNIFLVIL